MVRHRVLVPAFVGSNPTPPTKPERNNMNKLIVLTTVEKERFLFNGNEPILFLDDDIERIKIFKSHYPWCDVATTTEECIEKLKSSKYDFVFLDHDLDGKTYCNSDDTDTGAEVARWIVKNKPQIGNIIVHSYNNIGAEYMTQLLREHEYNSMKIPFFYLFNADIGDTNGC